MIDYSRNLVYGTIVVSFHTVFVSLLSIEGLADVRVWRKERGQGPGLIES